MQQRSRDNSKQQGMAMLVLAAMVGSVLIPMVGLAIDGSILFLVKTKLSASVDAAALAGARSLSVGLDLTSQTASATQTVNSYFNANFPNSYFGTTNPSVTVAIDESILKVRTVQVTGAVDSPLFFMRVLGFNSTRVSAGGQASRRDVNVMLVLDRSGSMLTAGACAIMANSAIAFVDKFTEGRDRIGLVTFNGAAHLDYAPTVNFKTQTPTMESMIGTLVCGGNTGTAQALNIAYKQIKNINEPGSLNLIVFFTDGLPNGIAFAANSLPIKTKADTRYGVGGNVSTLVATPKSTCTNASLPAGFIAQEGGDQPTGNTAGIMNSSGVAITSTSQPTVTSTACSYNGDANKMRLDISSIPASDAFGNSTTGYAAVETYPSGNYMNLLRVDTPTSIAKASKNAADNQATTVRLDGTFHPVIYCIGLGGTDPEPIDAVFMERMSNDPASPIFDPSLPTGMYVYAPSAAQLTDAFNKVASEILRLAK